MATGNIYPNMYTILLGPPAARKSTAVNLASKMLRQTGYTHISKGKTSAEQFLMDLSLGYNNLRISAKDLDIVSNLSLADTGESFTNHHVLIEAGELQDFLGNSNVTFISQLTNLWDNQDEHPYRTKNGANELISEPTISLLGGATQTSFKKVFPVDVVGQGLLSRFLLIYGSGPRSKIYNPKPLDESLSLAIVKGMKDMITGKNIPREYTMSDTAFEYSRHLYEVSASEITDPRFQYYTGRRNDHYMKLAIQIAAMNLHQEITANDCVLANTILTYTEKFMPLALGEFGQDHGAENTEHLFRLIKNSPNGITLKDLGLQALTIFKSMGELASHLLRLTSAKRVDKIKVGETIKYIAIGRRVSATSKMVDFKLLSEFRENPTFDTEYRVSEEQELKWELEGLVAEEKPAKKKQKITSSTPLELI